MGSAGDAGDEQRGGVVAAEFQVAAEFFGVDVDAAFFDFELADVAGAEMLRASGSRERQDVVDFEAGERRVGDWLRAGEIGRAGAEGGEIVFGGEHAFQVRGEDGGVDVEDVAVGFGRDGDGLIRWCR